MFTRLAFLLASFIFLTLVPAAAAQEPSPQHADAAWEVTYWNNVSLSGDAVLQRTEVTLDNDWGTGSPATGVSADRFSARWTRYVDLAAGTYRFTATSDDGMRVWVNDDLIINDWSDHAARSVAVDRTLSAGHHLIKVEYYENTGGAVARLNWSPVTMINNWRGEYFNNTGLSGSPVLVRDDTAVNFNWGSGSPAPGTINADGFSARWTRNLNLPAGNYRFTVTADDGVRLYVNDHLLIDSWQIQAARTYTGDIYLPGGVVPIRLDYFEQTGAAVAQLSWNNSSQPPTSPPPAGTVIVDDTSPGFITGGAAASWRTVNEGHNGRLLWTKNNDRARANYNWARWSPALTAGRYEVFVYIPERYTTTSSARYWVAHRDGFTLRTVDQSTNGNRWVSLGTYSFQGTSSDYVSLTDVTFETYLSRIIAFDAVKWEPR